MSWRLDGSGAAYGVFGCYNKTCMTALRLAQNERRVVRVTFVGAKVSHNRNSRMSDFDVHPNGEKNYRVDPTWWENG